MKTETKVHTYKSNGLSHKKKRQLVKSELYLSSALVHDE